MENAYSQIQFKGFISVGFKNKTMDQEKKYLKRVSKISDGMLKSIER